MVLLKTLVRSIEDQYKNISKMSQHVSSKVRPMENRVLLQDMDQALPVAEFDKIHSSIDDTIAKLRSEPDIYPQSFARKLRCSKRTCLELKAVSGCSGAFEAIIAEKEIDPLMKFDRTASIAEKDAIDVLKGLL